MKPSFSELLLAELASLLRVARRLTRSEVDAEDLVQATLLRALERKGDLRDGERMRAWLLQVQRSVLINGNRGLSRKLEVVRGSLAQAEEPSADLEAEIMDRRFTDELQRALERLAPELRDAILLREVEGLAYEEIARIQGCPTGTVRSRLARARLALIEWLSQNTEASKWQAAPEIGSRVSRRGTTVK
ncbi:MAG TPA: sigma-70 family RNA polymerase sigma factor [Polyangiaceae bacterium]|nr:sigma-70 family RNA polymerase sigma factor [Polyangiaceae bacterium]